jgi:hypothetical protein
LLDAARRVCDLILGLVMVDVLDDRFKVGGPFG